MTGQEILAAAIQQSAIDFSCTEEDFLRPDNVIVESKPVKSGSRYLEFPQICAICSYGSNIVVSCRRDLLPEAEALVNGIGTVHRCFAPTAV